MERIYRFVDTYREYSTITEKKRISCCVCGNRFMGRMQKSRSNSRIVYYGGECPVCGFIVGETYYKEENDEQ